MREVTMTKALKAWANNGASIEIRIGDSYTKRLYSGQELKLTPSDINEGRFYINR